MWSKYLSLPQTRLGWAAVVLASPVCALWLYGIIATLLSGNPITGEGVFMVLLFTGPLTVPAALAGLYAVGIKDERSWLVWLAMVPVLIYVSLFVLLEIGEIRPQGISPIRWP
jgi:hypothetical protein